MTTLRFTIALALMACATSAFAQGTPQQRAACRGDVSRFCRGIQETDAIHGCLQSNFSRISARCQQVLSGG